MTEVKAKLDKFGRVLIPKSLRDEHGLEAGSELELSRSEQGHLQIAKVRPGYTHHMRTDDLTGLLVSGFLDGSGNLITKTGNDYDGDLRREYGERAIRHGGSES